MRLNGVFTKNLKNFIILHPILMGFLSIYSLQVTRNLVEWTPPVRLYLLLFLSYKGDKNGYALNFQTFYTTAKFLRSYNGMMLSSSSVLALASVDRWVSAR